MSQNGTTPTTDENRAPATISTPLFFPMMPMFIPYGNANTAGQQYYGPAVYPNVSAYPSTGNHRQGNFGLGYNAFYGPFYPTTNNILSPTTHINNPQALMTVRPLIPPLLPLTQQQQQQQQYPIIANENERNKNLNIRECQSPVINQPKKEKQPLQIVDPNDNNTNVRIRKDSSSTSSLISHPESYQNPLPSSTPAQEIDSDNPNEDFLTFLEQNTKKPTTMPELNPFANEFSFVNNKTLTNESPITTNGIDHNTNNENQSSNYRLLFDNLIEKSLESIEAIKQSTKNVTVNDVSVQCNEVTDSMNRSTQTTDRTNNNDLIQEYSLRTIQLMDKLLENFRNIYQNELHNECKTMAHTCDELRHLVIFIHHVISSLSPDNEQRKQALLHLDTPFSNMIQDFSTTMINNNRHRTSSSSLSQITHGAGRGSHRLMTPINDLPLPSFSCRQIEPLPRIRSKLCLLCQRPVDDSDDVMHKLCRSLSSRPNTFSDA